jgi:hypothetical protein
MDRRDFLLVWLQTLLLTLFPWLRSERGIEVAGKAAEAMLPAVERAVFKGGPLKLTMVLKGFEVPGPWKRWINENAPNIVGLT